MDEIAEHNSAQSGRQSLLPGIRRLVHGMAICLLRSTTNPGTIYHGILGDRNLVRRCDQLRIVHGRTHLERVLLHRCASRKRPILGAATLH